MIVGTGIIILPRSLATEMGTTDGWISLMISTVIVMVGIVLIVRLQNYFPGQNLLQFLAEGKVGKWLSKLLAFSFIIYFICISAYLARFLALVISIYLLNLTPNEIIVMMILLLSTYAVSKGLQGIIHLNLMFTPLVIFGALGIITFEIPHMDLTNLLPIMSEGFPPILKGVKETTFTFLGIEILFFFMAYMKKSDLLASPLILAIGFISSIYLLIIIMTISIFDLESTQKIMFPMIELVKEVEVPGKIFERAEPFFITIWLMTMLNTIAISQYLSTNILIKEFMTKVKEDWVTAGLVFVIFMLAFIPKSVVELFIFSEWIAIVGGVNICLGLIFGYSSVWYRSQSNKNNKQEKEV